MALATLAKGPVGFILPLLVSLVYLSIQKDWKGIRGDETPSGDASFRCDRSFLVSSRCHEREGRIIST